MNRGDEEDYESDIEYEWEKLNSEAICYGEDKKPYLTVKDCLKAGNKIVYLLPQRGC